MTRVCSYTERKNADLICDLYLSAVGWLLGCLSSQQHASVSQGRICSDNLTCCLTEIEVADQTFHLTQSQYNDTGLTSPSADPITPGAGQGSHWSANFQVTGMTRTRKNLGASGIQTRDLRALEADALTTWPTRRSICVRQHLKLCEQICPRDTQPPWSLSSQLISDSTWKVSVMTSSSLGILLM